MTAQRERDDRDSGWERLDRSESVEIQRRLSRVENQIETTSVDVKEIKTDVKLLLISHYESAGSRRMLMTGLGFFKTLPGILLTALSVATTVFALVK